MRFRTLLLLGCAAIVSARGVPSASAPRYAATRDGLVVHLDDHDRQTRVSIVPSIGNVAYAMTVKGQNVLYWPFGSIDEFKAKPTLSGIPLLAPFANRLDEPAFYANGKRFAFDLSLGNVRTPMPIHGFLQYTDRWQTSAVDADDRSARVTSRLEVFRDPVWMKQWPFAHTIEITHILQDGMLEVRTTITNHSVEPMPVSIGFHPYFQVTDAPRDDWTIAIGARTRWLLAANKIPTGEREPIERLLPNPTAARLADYNLDDVFGDLIRDPATSAATMSVTGRSQRVDVLLGPRYRSVVIYAPTGRSFICFEPMAGITNALNHAHRGVYRELQSVPPGGTWQESFWVKPSGF